MQGRPTARERIQAMGEARNWLFEPSFNRSIKVRRTGQRLTSDAGVLLLREADHRLGLVESLARRMSDPRNPDLIRYTLTELLRERLYALAQGYRAQDDLDRLAHDPAFKMAVWDRRGEQLLNERLASQPTLSRLLDTVAAFADDRQVLRDGLADWMVRYVRGSGQDRAVQLFQFQPTEWSQIISSPTITVSDPASVVAVVSEVGSLHTARIRLPAAEEEESHRWSSSFHQHQQHYHWRLRLDRVLQARGHVDPRSGLSFIHVIAQAHSRLALHKEQHGRFRRRVFGKLLALTETENHRLHLVVLKDRATQDAISRRLGLFG